MSFETPYTVSLFVLQFERCARFDTFCNSHAANCQLDTTRRQAAQRNWVVTTAELRHCRAQPAAGMLSYVAGVVHDIKFD